MDGRTDGQTDIWMDGWMGRHVLFTCNCRRSVTHDRLKVPNLSAIDLLFFPPMFLLLPLVLVQSGLTQPPRGISTCEILYFQTPLPGIRPGICIYAPTQYPPKFDFQQPEPSWFLQLQRLRKGCSLFLFYFIFRCLDLVFVHPNLHQTPHPYSIWP